MPKRKGLGMARPFLKWAGGKGQILPELEAHLPPEVRTGKIKRYIEPFLGGGAFFFYLAQRYPIEEYYLQDINAELILIYRVVQQDCEELIARLEELSNLYYAREEAGRRELFYAIRGEYNRKRWIIAEGYGPAWIERAAQAIFLNKTCFNGLYRLNSRGEFNVPFGRYRRPKICDAENLRAVSAVLSGVVLQTGDFTTSAAYGDAATFVYCDPPYRPISKTSSFTAYAADNFSDCDQLRLARFCRELAAKGAKVMISNSDPKNINPEDNFFEEAYQGFYLNRIRANRMINCDSNKRGEIWELVITSYPPEADDAEKQGELLRVAG